MTVFSIRKKGGVFCQNDPRQKPPLKHGFSVVAQVLVNFSPENSRKQNRTVRGKK